MKKILLAILLSIFMASTVQAVESLSQSIKASGAYKVYILTWVTDSSGNFTATDTTQTIDGIVMLVEFIPSTSPTPSYDITLRNTNGIDILGDTAVAGSEAFDGVGANLSATVPKETQVLLNGNYGAIPVFGVLTIDVLNAGNDEGGTVRIHYLSIN